MCVRVEHLMRCGFGFHCLFRLPCSCVVVAAAAVVVAAAAAAAAAAVVVE